MIKNYDEFVSLIEFYKRISLSDLEECEDASGVMCFNDYCMGFGTTTRCVLCQKVGYEQISPIRKPKCADCIYSVTGSVDMPCTKGYLGENMEMLQDYHRAPEIRNYLDERIKLMLSTKDKALAQLEKGKEQ